MDLIIVDEDVLLTEGNQNENLHNLGVHIINASTDHKVVFDEVYSSVYKQSNIDIESLDKAEDVKTNSHMNGDNSRLTNMDMEYYVSYYHDLPIGILQISVRYDLEQKKKIGEINALYLLDKYCGKGHGSIILHSAIEEFKRYCCDQINLWVLEENKRAIKFYEKMGFILNGNKKEIFKGKVLIQMQCILHYS